MSGSIRIGPKMAPADTKKFTMIMPKPNSRIPAFWATCTFRMHDENANAIATMVIAYTKSRGSITPNSVYLKIGKFSSNIKPKIMTKNVERRTRIVK